MTTDEIIKAVNKIVEGCRNVKSDNASHEEARQLATLVINDCNILLLQKLKGE
jgi:hypothetical protein